MSIGSASCAESVQWACDEAVADIHKLWKKYCIYKEDELKYEIYRPRKHIINQAIDIVKKHFDGWSE